MSVKFNQGEDKKPEEHCGLCRHGKGAMCRKTGGIQPMLRWCSAYKEQQAEKKK